MTFGMPTALFPALAEAHGRGAFIGWLYAAPSAGAFMATMTSGWTRGVRRHGLVIAIAASVWGLAIAGAGMTDRLPLVLSLLALAGAGDMVSGLFRGRIWNETIPDHLRGRLASIEMVSYSTGPLLGKRPRGSRRRAGRPARLDRVRRTAAQAAWRSARISAWIPALQSGRMAAHGRGSASTTVLNLRGSKSS